MSEEHAADPDDGGKDVEEEPDHHGAAILAGSAAFASPGPRFASALRFAEPRAQRRTDLLGLRVHRCGERAQATAQRVDLVEQVQHDRHGLVIDGEFDAQLADEPYPRDVDFMEEITAGPAFGTHP